MNEPRMEQATKGLQAAIDEIKATYDEAGEMIHGTYRTEIATLDAKIADLTQAILDRNKTIDDLAARCHVAEDRLRNMERRLAEHEGSPEHQAKVKAEKEAKVAALKAELAKWEGVAESEHVTVDPETGEVDYPNG